ncbi:hypothetical protein R9X49_07820 [Pectobacterium carotovorum]|uniref:hypothetical protein n=1 Tax=Pectobacterium carotovorum TaxID=554 RepID=UPI0029DB9E88|nr:hypothetical protein [Pectobacterium carotovorum]MDX6915014.1 hypothetical protein [Pectobacterium carotovorum]
MGGAWGLSATNAKPRRSISIKLFHHPTPTYIQWPDILAITNDDTEYLDENRSITSDMLKPYGSNRYIRTRNFVTLLEGSAEKLWVNWIIEGKDKPAYPLASQ